MRFGVNLDIGCIVSSFGGKCGFVTHFDPYVLFIVKTLLWMTGWNEHNFESRRHNELLR
jgi:hypothetical protein